MKTRSTILLFLVAAVFLNGCGTPASVPAEDAAKAWFNLGNAYTELGRHSDAVKAYIKARDLDSDLLSAGFNLARVHIILEQYAEGLEQLELLLENDPKNRNVLETIAWVYHLQGDNAAALEIYDRVLADFDGSRNSLYNSALILSDDGSYTLASKRFERLFELYPEEDSVMFEIAFLEAALENPEKSLIWLDKRLAVDPDDIAALELSGDMHVLRKSYGDALIVYRQIFPLLTAGEEFGLPTEVEGRVSFKVGELLLLYIEDVEGGTEAIQRSVDTGWSDQVFYARLLSYSEAEWYETVSKLLVVDDVEADTKESVPAED